MKVKLLSFTGFLIIVLLLVSAPVWAANTVMENGIAYFGASRFSEALHTFRNVIADPDETEYHGDAYFWLAKTHMAMNNLDDSEKNLEFFLLNFEDNRYFPEAFYQKGRLLYLQKEYEKAIQVLYNFIEQFPANPYAGNAYFWIGESLYDLGHFDKAAKVFRTVVSDFPKSFKYDAAQYRISLIELKYREQELMKFLKWSHEEALKTIEEFQIREKTYEQAITAYQKKIAEYAEAGTERKIEELTLAVQEKEAEIVKLQNTIKNLNVSIETLRQENQQLTTDGESETEDAVETLTVTVTDEELEEQRKLLELKEQALDLKAFYLNWLSENAE